MATLFEEVTNNLSQNGSNLLHDSIVIEDLRNDMRRLEETRLQERTDYLALFQRREEQWQAFCQQQETNFKAFVTAITAPSSQEPK